MLLFKSNEVNSFCGIFRLQMTSAWALKVHLILSEKANAKVTSLSDSFFKSPSNTKWRKILKNQKKIIISNQYQCAIKQGCV